MAADDRKNTEKAETRITERMLLDLMREAALQDRKLSDYLRFILRNHLYGHCRAGDSDSNEDNCRH